MVGVLPPRCLTYKFLLQNVKMALQSGSIIPGIRAKTVGPRRHLPRVLRIRLDEAAARQQNEGSHGNKLWRQKDREWWEHDKLQISRLNQLQNGVNSNWLTPEQRFVSRIIFHQNSAVNLTFDGRREVGRKRDRVVDANRCWLNFLKLLLLLQPMIRRICTRKEILVYFRNTIEKDGTRFEIILLPQQECSSLTPLSQYVCNQMR